MCSQSIKRSITRRYQLHPAGFVNVIVKKKHNFPLFYKKGEA
uniref:Uncharacterized protein n=1 Tax=Arundo donax TaxID=35708 RepID=A0A0A9FZD4_ARUDO